MAVVFIDKFTDERFALITAHILCLNRFQQLIGIPADSAVDIFPERKIHPAPFLIVFQIIREENNRFIHQRIVKDQGRVVCDQDIGNKQQIVDFPHRGQIVSEPRIFFKVISLFDAEPDVVIQRRVPFKENGVFVSQRPVRTVEVKF